VEQLDNSLDAVEKLKFSEAELAAIEKHAIDGNIDLWRGARVTMR
jgi:L-glyceraldehyde 3-phosphate reductase